MNQKLTKSFTEAGLSLPLKRPATAHRDPHDYSTSMPVSKENSSERDHLNNTYQNNKTPQPESNNTKKLAKMLCGTSDLYYIANSLPYHSHQGSPQVAANKTAKNASIMGHSPLGKQDIELLKPKEIAKATLYRMFAKDGSFKNLPKSPTIALKKGNSFDIKIGESQAESRARLKLKQIAQIYNDTSIVDNLKVNQHQTGSIPRSNNNSQSPNSRARSVSTKSASKLLTRTYIAPPSANVTPVNNVMPAQDRHLRERPRNKYHSIGNNLGATRDMILNPKIPGGTPKHRKLFSSASTAFINNSSMNQNSISHSHMLHLANNTKSLENSQLDGSFSTNRKENIEMIVNELTKPQESNIDNFNGYRAAFDALIDNAQNDHIQTNFNFDLLVKVKNCYDKLIEQLLGRESLAQNIYDENKEFATEFQKLSKENQRLERDMHKTNEENIKLKELLNKLNSKLPNHNNDNKADLDSYDSPLVSVQNTELINLKQVIHKQEESIKFLKFKESRMVRLLLAIKKRGFDIESIYNEEVRDKPENGSDINLKLNFPDFSLHRDSTTAPSDNSNKDALDSAVDSIDKKLRKTFSGLKSASESVPSSPVMKHANMDKNLKDKLKLDLNFLKRNQSELIPQQVVNQIPQIPKFEINEKVLNKQGVGFHDEFMSKIGEFSLSWRQAALNERKV